MARKFTVTELITRIRERSNTERSNFVTDDEVIRYIDQGYTKLMTLSYLSLKTTILMNTVTRLMASISFMTCQLTSIRW